MERTPTAWIGEQVTILGPGPAGRFTTPADAASEGFGRFLDRLHARTLGSPAASVIVDGPLARLLGFRGAKAPGLGSRRDTPALAEARARGWQVAEERPWMICTRPDADHRGRRITRTIYVGVAPWLDARQVPLLATEDPQSKKLADPDTLIGRMHWWYRLTGVPYFGDHPGVCAMSAIRDQYSSRTGKVPWWKPNNWDQIAPAYESTETALEWQARDPHTLGWEHQYDITTMHLRAAGEVHLAIDKLAPTQGSVMLVGRNRPGYYRITVPHWNLWDRMPHPVGNARPGADAWVTNPTVDLLFEVAQLGLIAEPDVHAAWVSETGGRVLRSWSETLSKALKVAGQFPDPAVFKTLKAHYKAGVGMLTKSSSRIFRPDWDHNIVAQSRADLWRKVWTEGQAHDHWPVHVGETDTVTYASDNPDPLEAWPATFKRAQLVYEGSADEAGIEPGKWHHKRTVAVARTEAHA